MLGVFKRKENQEPLSEVLEFLTHPETWITGAVLILAQDILTVVQYG